REHPLLPGREAAVALTTPQVADDLGHLHHIATVQLLEVRLVATRPVGRLLDVCRAEDVEHAVETLLVDDVPDAHQVEVARRNANAQALLCDDPEYEVLPVFSLDGPHLDVFDDSCSVIRVNNRFADRESP